MQILLAIIFKKKNLDFISLSDEIVGRDHNL